MAYRITIKTEDGERSYFAIGNLAALQDEAYDDGALGVTAMVLR